MRRVRAHQPRHHRCAGGDQALNRAPPCCRCSGSSQAFRGQCDDQTRSPRDQADRCQTLQHQRPRGALSLGSSQRATYQRVASPSPHELQSTLQGFRRSRCHRRQSSRALRAHRSTPLAHHPEFGLPLQQRASRLPQRQCQGVSQCAHSQTMRRTQVQREVRTATVQCSSRESLGVVQQDLRDTRHAPRADRSRALSSARGMLAALLEVRRDAPNQLGYQ